MGLVDYQDQTPVLDIRVFRVAEGAGLFDVFVNGELEEGTVPAGRVNKTLLEQSHF